VNAVNKAERYIALSRLILLSPVFAGVTIHPIYFYAIFSSLSPKDCRALSQTESRKPIVGKPDVGGIRVFGIIGELRNEPARPCAGRCIEAQTVLLNCTFHPRGQLRSLCRSVDASLVCEMPASNAPGRAILSLRRICRSNLQSSARCGS
jgi:hypothetical protein